MSDFKKLIFLVFLIGIVYFFNLNNYLTAGGDDTHYFLLARSLAETKTYSDIYLPEPKPHAIYPPLFSFILSILMQSGIEKIYLLKLLSLFCSLASLIVLWFILKYHNIKPYKIILLFSLHPLLIYKSTNLLTEPLYILLSLLAILFLDLSKRKNFYLLVAIFFMILAFYTRTVGIVFLGVIFIFYKDDIKKLLLSASLFSFAASFWFLRLFRFDGLYLEFLLKKENNCVGLVDLFFRFFRNFLVYIAKVFGELFFYPYLDNITKKSPLIFIKVFLSLFLVFFIFRGYLNIAKKNRSFCSYTLFFLIICFFWPFYGARFILPIFCFLILFLFEGLENFKFYRFKNIIFFLLLFLYLFASLPIVKGSFYSKEEFSFLDACFWMKSNTKKESIILSRKPTVSFYFSSRPSITYKHSTDIERKLNELKSKKVDYIIFDIFGKEYKEFGLWDTDKFLSPLLEKYPSCFKLEYVTLDTETKVYKFECK
ncbi:MAG: hypothetical protein NC935_03260 [Candidatus Omnitrophica bacterium]|nr:hypothetical protein [Candidatus Omnitrophota bacterium]